MANRGYDVVVDVDTEVQNELSLSNMRTVPNNPQGDLGHTDLQEDNLEFHSSSTLTTNYPFKSIVPPSNLHPSQQ
jgi:protein YIPF1/2